MNNRLFALFLLVSITLISCSEEEEKDNQLSGSDIKIERISTKSFSFGDTITVYGRNFGDSPLNNYVDFGGTAVTAEAVLSWSDTEITVIVPEDIEDGSIYISSRESNSLSFEVIRPWIVNVIKIFVQISLGITSIFIYLKINKIWKRKHELEVADSQSLTGLSIYVLNCILWVGYYTLVEYDPISIMDTSFYIFEGFIFFTIGTGIFVKGQRTVGLKALIKRALKLERKEADYLLKKWFKPKNADVIINILHQLAMIDDDLDPKEQEMIEAFSKEWNIRYSVEALNNQRLEGSENNYIRLRKSVEGYLNTDPPIEQAAQLRDMMDALVNVDDVVTQEEELISSELMGLINRYLSKDTKAELYHVLVVPQLDEHEHIILETFPDAKKYTVTGGSAYSIGSYYSQKYADMICQERRKINIFTVVHSQSTELAAE